jgi:hypothetical protein
MFTDPEKPPADVIWIFAVDEPPTELMVSPVELLETLTAESVPVSATVCGEPLALSVMVTAPVRAPPAVGVKVTEILQFAPAATLEPQVLDSAKSPDAAIEVMLKAARPELVSVTDCAELVEPVVCPANVRLVGVSVTPGVGGAFTLTAAALDTLAAKFVSPK